MKKELRLLLVSVLTVLIMSGCANAGNEVSVQNDTATEEKEKGLSTETDTGKVSLKVWGAAEDQDLLNEITQKFVSENAGKADFEITVMPEAESTCKDDFLMDVENAPDVFAFVDDQLLSFVAAGTLSPVKEEDVKTRNNKSAVDAATVKDTLYAYPLTADNGYFMYYDKSVFTEDDVKELDRMMEVAAQNGKKVTMDMGNAWYLYSFFGNTGLQVGLNEDGISNYCTWNATDGNVKGIDVAEALLQIAANPGFQAGGDDVLLEGIKNGSVAAGVSGVWNAQEIQNVWGSNYGAVKLPTFTCADEQVQMASFIGYKMMGVNAYSEHVAWAGKLAEYISNEENQMLRFEKRGQAPANTKASESPEVAKSPAIQAILAQAEFSSLQRIGGNFWEPVQNFGSDIIAGNPTGKDLQEMLDTMVEGVTASNAK